jgi:hypothetical protein
MSKKRRVFLVALLVVLLLVVAGGATAAWLAQPKKNAIILDVYTTDGLPFKGTAEVDGKTQELTGTVPKQFTLEGRRILFSFTSTEESGEMRAKISIGNLGLASTGALDVKTTGIHGWVQSNWGWSLPDYWLEPFTKDAPDKWLKAPPPP